MESAEVGENGPGPALDDFGTVEEAECCIDAGSEGLESGRRWRDCVRPTAECGAADTRMEVVAARHAGLEKGHLGCGKVS